MKYFLLFIFLVNSTLSAKSLHDKAIHYYANGDNKNAAWYFDRSCTKGNMRSCYSLANLYLNGSGVIKSTKKAIDLLENSCAALHTSSCLYLAFLYRGGTHVSQNNMTSQYYFNIACRRGNKTACKAIKNIIIPDNL